MSATPDNSAAVEQVDSRRLLVVQLLLSLVLSLPMLATSYLTFFDYPNHVARYLWLSQYQNTDQFHQYFTVNGRLIPNIGFDVLAINLAKIMPATIAAQGLLFLSIFFTAFGLCRLSTLLSRRASYLSLVSAFFVWNFFVFAGFNNFILGYAMFIWAIIAFRRYLDKANGAAIAYTLLNAVAFITHAYIILFIFMFSAIMAWMERPSKQERLRVFGLLGVPFIGLILSKIAAEAPKEASMFILNGPVQKVKVVGQTFLSGELKFDAIFISLAAAAVVGLFASRKVQIPKIAWVSAATSFALFVVMPFQLTVFAGDLDIRVVPAGFAFFFAFLIPRGNLPKSVVALIVAALLVRAGTLFREIQVRGRVAEHASESIAALPDNAIVYNAALPADKALTARLWNPAVVHMAHFALWKKPIFVSGMFAFPEAQPILYNSLGGKLSAIGISRYQESTPDHAAEMDEVMGMIKKSLDAVEPAFWQTHPAYLFVGLADGIQPPTPSNLEVVTTDPHFVLYKYKSIE